MTKATVGKKTTTMDGIKDFFKHPKDQAYLSLLGILVIGVIVGWLGVQWGNSIRENTTTERDVYLSATQADTVDGFERALRAGSGNVLAYGTVTQTDDECVSFEEMNGCYLSVQRHKEEYVTITELYPCGKTLCTRITGSWMRVKTETLSVDNISFLGVDIPYDDVKINHSNVSAEKVISEQNQKDITLLGHYEPARDARYSYSVVEEGYSGTLFAKVNSSHNMSETKFFKNHTIEQTIESKNSNALSVMVTIAVIILAVIGTGYVAYRVVVENYNDGEYNGF